MTLKVINVAFRLKLCAFRFQFKCRSLHAWLKLVMRAVMFLFEFFLIFRSIFTWRFLFEEVKL